jgi:hypothetical protein
MLKPSPSTGIEGTTAGPHHLGFPTAGAAKNTACRGLESTFRGYGTTMARRSSRTREWYELVAEIHAQAADDARKRGDRLLAALSAERAARARMRAVVGH